jgi:hypothetical protein
MEELGIECRVGHPAQIRAAEPRKQKHDRRDADLILKLLAENRFAGTSRPSDSLPTFVLDFWFMHLLQPARLLHCSGADRASRFSRAEFPCMPGSQTSQSPVSACDFAPTGIAFRP